MEIMTLAQILDRAVYIMKKYMKTIVLYTLVYGIILFVGAIILALIGGISAVVSAGIFDNVPIAVTFGVLLIVIILSVSYSQHVGIIKIASQEYLKENIQMEQAMRAAAKSIPKVSAIVISALFMFAPILALLGWLGYLLIRALDNALTLSTTLDGRIAFIIIIVITAILLYSFVVLSFLTWFLFSFHALIIEKKGIFASIKRSFELVRHNFWRIFGSLTLILLTVYAIRISFNSILGLLGSLLYLLMKFLNAREGFILVMSMAVSYIQFPVNIAYALLVTPISFIAITHLYFNERFKKEGLDLILKLKEIQKNDERTSSTSNTI